MEYVPGRSLQDRLDKQGPLSLPEILRIGMQTAAGLAAAHAQGLVHRDVKPANILLENGVERVRLTDFGLARAAADAALTHSGVVAGTPHYMAPEQASGETIDHRADLFSLGSTLYAMCAGHPPFRAETPLAVLRRVCDHEPRPLREINPEVPAWLEAIVARLTAKDPARRFQTATEVADLLERCLAHVQQPLSLTSARRAGRDGTTQVGLANGLEPAGVADRGHGGSRDRQHSRSYRRCSRHPSRSASREAAAPTPGSRGIARSAAAAAEPTRSPRVFRKHGGWPARSKPACIGREDPTGRDAVSSLASELAQKLRALESEIASKGEAAPAYSSVRPARNPDGRR